MRLDPVQIPTSIPTTSPTNTGPTAQLRPGNLMLATVVQRLGGDQVLMVVENMLLQAQSRLPLQQGQLLFLEVLQQGQGERPALRLLQQGPQLPLTELFRNSLPYQQPMAQVLQAMMQRQVALPEAARSLVEQLTTGTSPQQLAQPQGLRRALENSGIFLESRLARGGGAVQADVKGLLLRLQAVLQEAMAQQEGAPPGADKVTESLPGSPGRTETAPVPRQQAPSAAPQLPAGSQDAAAVDTRQAGVVLRHDVLNPQATPAGRHEQAAAPLGDRHTIQGVLDAAKAGLARVEWQQASALNQSGSSRSISLELPMLVGGVPQAIPFRLMRDEVPVGEKDQQHAAATEPLWSLAFSVPLGERLGRLDAVVWQRQQTVSVALWAAAEETARLCRQGMPVLQDALRAHGLTVGRVDVFDGYLPMRLDASPTEAPRLVDLLA